jgi:hypothetical protein
VWRETQFTIRFLNSVATRSTIFVVGWLSCAGIERRRHGTLGTDLQVNQNENPVRNSNWFRIPYVNSGSFSVPQRV